MTRGALFALALAVIGLVQLALGANLLAALVAFATLASYVLVYTPLKRLTSLATVIGAVPGALPPMIGWAAATGELSLEAWVLFAIVFFWQMPHVLAISWMYREDYERGGIRVLPVEEPDGAARASDGQLRRGAHAGEPAADDRRSRGRRLLRRRAGAWPRRSWCWRSSSPRTEPRLTHGGCSSRRCSICRCSGC